MVTLQKTGLLYAIMMRKSRFVVLLLVCANYQVLCEYLSLSEGDSCTWDGLNGTCVQLHRCLSAKDFIQSENQPPICDFKGKVPVICCVDCELVDDARNIIIGDIGLIYLNGQKAHDQCVNFKHKLRTFQKHVVIYYDKEWTVEEDSNCQELQYIYKGAVAPAGGNDVWRGQFPHMALLGYGAKWTTAQWLCAGSIISHKFVLTAGHCISSPSVGPVTYLGLGVLKRTDPPGRWERYRVKRIIPHPDFHPPSKYNDIALLETFTPIVFNSYARPACINMRENLTAKYNEATGWGKLGYRRELADNMQVIFLEEFSEEECKREYPPHRHLVNGYNHTTQMCYGRRDQLIDTCEGDSGGPLHDKEEDSDHIIGVTSYGRACAVSTGAGIYTRVSFYLPWIESIVWPDA